MIFLKKYKKYVLSLTIILLAAVFVFGSFFNKNKYVDDVYGFSVTYPKDWKRSEGNFLGGEILRLENNNGNQLIIAYANSLTEYSMQTPTDKRSTLVEALSYELMNIQEITIDGNQAYMGDYENKNINYKGKYIFVEYNNHIYSLMYDHSLEGDAGLEKMLDSFTFLQ
jgi:hypothetical protein